MPQRKDISARLRLSDDQFERLHHDVAHTRSTSETVRLNKQAVENLLIDYSNLIDELERIAAVTNS